MTQEIAHHTGQHADWLWEIVMALSALVVILVGWVCRLVWVKVTKIADQATATCNKIAALELKVAEEYVSVLTFKETIADFKRELHESITPLYSRLTEIEGFLRQRPPS
jgi:hypothetical protein